MALKNGAQIMVGHAKVIRYFLGKQLTEKVMPQEILARNLEITTMTFSLTPLNPPGNLLINL